MILPKLIQDSQLTIVPFEARHALWITNSNRDGEITKRFRHQTAVWLAGAHLTKGYTAVHEGRPIACGGITLIRPHTGMGFAYVGDMTGRKKWFVRIVKQIMEVTALEMALKRLESVVVADFSSSIHWLKLLGFEIETPGGMKNFGPNGETYLLMSRCF